MRPSGPTPIRIFSDPRTTVKTSALQEQTKADWSSVLPTLSFIQSNAYMQLHFLANWLGLLQAPARVMGGHS